MAAKTNASASDIDKTTFWWTGLCGTCHPGGGPSEFDRDGELLYDVASGQFGYEKLGKVAADVTLDGDYSEVSNQTGALSEARWDVTGVAEPDCMLCHRADRTVTGGKNMNWVWRTATLRAKTALVDSATSSVPAFAAAATAGQGWFSNLALATVPAGKPPLATTLDIDYQAGVDDGSLLAAGGAYRVAKDRIVKSPKDYACWGCHGGPDTKKRGRAWFDKDKDVHYAQLNNLDDASAANDVAAGDSTACTYCHPAGADHNFAKGNAPLGSVRDDTDYEGFRTCAGCHLEDSIDRDPGAPVPPSGFIVHNDRHREILSCEACHIPYKEVAAQHVVDNATTGSTIDYWTDVFTSADPLDPASTDKSRWYPSFILKTDADGEQRLFPVKLLLSAWWGEWDQAGTTSTLSDDVISPIPLWRVRAAIAAGAPAVSDDNGDGKLEVNTATETLAYIAALKTNDVHGNPVATNPVLVRGGHVYYEDAGTLHHFEYHGTGIKTESSHPFAVNHNVLGPSKALGQSNKCNDCHNKGSSPTFDRLILVDPWDEDGDPVYKTVRELTGVDPF